MELNIMEYLYQNIPTDWQTKSINPFFENFEVDHLGILLTLIFNGLNYISSIVL